MHILERFNIAHYFRLLSELDLLNSSELEISWLYSLPKVPNNV